MPRSIQESDDDAELKIDRLRTLTACTAVSSPSLRRSSRIKQNRSTSVSPCSDSTSSQVGRSTRKRIMDSSSDVLKERRSRRTSMSSDISEIVEIYQTPSKRITRSSAAASVTTPSKMNTRASKRFVRAGSETKSPSPMVRTTRKTRASSVDLESLANESKSNTPINIRKRASVLPVNSPLREEVEELLIPYVRLDRTISEREETTNTANLNFSPDKSLYSQQSQKASEKRKSLDKDNAEKEMEDEIPEHSNTSSDKLSSPENQNVNETRKSMSKDTISDEMSFMVSQLDETFDLAEKNEISNKSNNMDIIMVDNEENLGDANCLQDKVSSSQVSQKLNKKRKSVIKDNEKGIEKDDSLSQEQEPNQSKNKSEIHNDGNKSMQNKSLDEKQCKSISSNDDSIKIIATSNNDNNDTTLQLEEQNPCLVDEVSSNVSTVTINLDNSEKSLTNMEVLSSVNEKSNDQSIVKDEQPDDQNDAIENYDLINMSVEESKLPNAVETIESTSNDSSAIELQNNKLSDFTDSAKKKLDLLFEKESTNQDTKQTSIEKTSDDLETNNLPLGKIEQILTIVDSDSDSNFTNMFVNKQKDETANEDNSAEDSRESCNSRSMEKEQKNESEADCELVLVDKQAWLAARNMEDAKEAETSEYDSDDTLIKKSRLDAVQANSGIKSNMKMLHAISEEDSTDLDVEEIDVLPTKAKKLHKALEKKLKTGMDSSITYVKDSDSSNNTNKSEQVAKATRRLSETFDRESKVSDDADKLNKSSRRSKENTPRRKSLQKKELLNKSPKDTSMKQTDRNTQDIFMDELKKESETENEEMIITSQERHSLNKSRNKDNATEEGRSEEKKKKKKKSLSRDSSNKEEEQCLNRSTEKKSKTTIKPVNVNDNETKDNEAVVVTDSGFPNYSMITYAGSIIDDSNDSDEKIKTSNSNVIFAKANSDNDTDENSSVNSDVRKEYNLDGAEQQFDDDNVPNDECRASESEYSDPNDNGSDLADFIVDDDEMEVEKEEEDSDEEQEKDDEDKQSEEEGNESKEEEEKVDIKNKKQKKRNATKDYKQVVEVEECTTSENEDADDEHSEVEIDFDDSSVYVESKEDESLKMSKSKKDESIDSSCISTTKKKQVAKMKKNEEIVQLDTSNSNKNKKTQPKDEKTISLISFESPSSIKIKRKSHLQHSEKIDTEQDSLKQLDESMTSQFSRKLSKLHAPMECSTPKYSFPKHKLEFNIETPEALEKTQKNEDKLDDKSEIVQNTSSKKTKSKKSTKERNTSLTSFVHQNKDLPEKLLNISLPTDLVKTMGKTDPSKMVKLHKTLSFTHTETPTIRHLRKEKLNESAPVSKLHLEDLSKENSSTIEKKEREEKEDIEKIEMKEKKGEDVPNLEPNLDNNRRKRKRQKKNKKQVEEALKENVDKALFEDTIELETSQERKRIKFNESPSVKDDICDDTSQINEGKKKRKRKRKKKEQTDVSKDSEKEADPHQKDRNETELMKHSEKNKKAKTSSNSESNANENDITMKEKSEQQKQEMVQSEETSLKVHKKKKKKQKKEEKAPLLETKEVSEEKSNKPQSKNTELDTRNTAITKMRQEMMEAIHAVQMRIKSKELEKKKTQEAVEKKKQEAIEKKKQEAIEKKKQERAAQIQKQNLQEQNSKSKKRKKETTEKSAFAPSSTGSLKRLSDDVINLLPAKTKRRKLSQNEKSVAPSQPKSSKSKDRKMKNVQLSSSGSTTEFIVADLKKIKKEPSKISAAVTSFRQRMLDRNERQPISAYLMYLKNKQESLKN